MSQHSDSTAEQTSSKSRNADTLMIIRIIAAAVIFAITLILDLAPFIIFILRVLAVAVAAYDLALYSVEAVENKDYLNTKLVILFVTVVSFAIGFSWEGTALVIIYQIGTMATDYVYKRTKVSAIELIKKQDENIVAKVSSLINDDNNLDTEFSQTIKSSADLVLKATLFFALGFAILLPLFTSFTYLDSIHRALMIIIIANPMSSLVAMPAAYIVSMCHEAGEGIIFKNANVVDKLSMVDTAVFDKTGIFTEEAPALISIDCDTLGSETFLNAVAHALYYSEQPVAKAVQKAFTGDYMLEVLSDFNEIPGLGVEVKFQGSQITLAKKEYFDSLGIDVPGAEEDNLQQYFMYMGSKYVGSIVVSNDFNSDSADLSIAMKQNGLSKTILLTEDGKHESEEAAAALGFDNFYSQCSEAKKKEIIADIANQSQAPTMFIYVTGIESHSAASVDIRVARKGKYADALVIPQAVSNLPDVITLTRRTREVCETSAIFAFIIKALVVFLAINGNCTIWFALFMDFAAGIASLLNSIRVTDENIINKLMAYRR